VRKFAARLARGDVPFGRAPSILDVTADAYYADPGRHFRRLYERWVGA
jgi:hypothetical protein